MNQFALSLASLGACAILTLPHSASAQTSAGMPAAITTPDRVETRIGTLDFKDGMPTKQTIDKINTIGRKQTCQARIQPRIAMMP